MNIDIDLKSIIAEHATDLISIHAPSGAYLDISPSCKELLGYEREEMVNRSPYEFMHGEDLKAAQATHKSMLKSLRTHTVPFRLKHKDGHYKWFESRTKSIPVPGTRMVKYTVSISREIGDRIEVDKQVDTLMSLCPHPICFIDNEGNIRRINKSFPATFGFTRESYSRRRFIDFVDKRHRSQFRKEIKKGFEYTHDFKTCIRTKDSSCLEVECRTSPIHKNLCVLICNPMEGDRDN